MLAELLGSGAVDLAGTAEIKQALRDATDEAVRRGAFGAPTFFMGEELFFGNDRIDFVERAAR